jgi:hypothetical protein
MSYDIQKEYEDRYRKKLVEFSERTKYLPIEIGDESFTASQVIEQAIKVAADKAVGAAMSGGMSDGGADVMMDLLAAWICGLESRIPKKFEKVKLAILRETCSNEYTELQRLKEKFGEK